MEQQPEQDSLRLCQLQTHSLPSSMGCIVSLLPLSSHLPRGEAIASPSKRQLTSSPYQHNELQRHHLRALPLPSAGQRHHVRHARLPPTRIRLPTLRPRRPLRR